MNITDKKYISYALKISLLYLLIASFWIIITDFLVLDKTVSKFPFIQTFKGLIFVLVTSLIIFLLLARHERHREKQKEKILESENRYQTFIDQVSEVIYRIDLPEIISNDMSEELQLKKIIGSGYIAECNQAFLTKYGIKEKKNIYGKPVSFHQELINESLIKKFIASGYIVNNHEVKVKDLDGQIKYFVYSLSGFSNQKNFLSCIWIVINDITRIRTSERKLAMALEGADLGIWELHIPSRQVHYNERLATMIGYDIDELPSNVEEWSDLLHPEDYDQIMNQMKQHIQGESDEFRLEFRVKTKLNEYKWLLSVGKILEWDEYEKPLRATGIHLDISGRKKQESELAHHNEELQKANQELDNFVYRVSHDLRAPITSSLGLARLSKNETDITIQKQYAQMQENSLIKLDKFIHDILDYSRNSRMEIIPKAIDFSELTNQVIQNYTKLQEERPIQVKVSINQELEFNSDELRLGIILNNLISNAFKFYNPYQEKSYVKIDINVNKDYTEIMIEDNGIGIEEKHLDKLFLMFYRATDKKPGSGIGLYIVQDCLKKLNGTIEVHSELGSGCTFKMIVPNLVKVSNLA